MAGWLIFWTIFCKDFKDVEIFMIKQFPLTRKLCLACLLPFFEQASWEELACQGGLSNQKTNKGTFVRVEKIGFWQSPVKIRDVVATPHVHENMVENWQFDRPFTLKWSKLQLWKWLVCHIKAIPLYLSAFVLTKSWKIGLFYKMGSFALLWKRLQLSWWGIKFSIIF